MKKCELCGQEVEQTDADEAVELVKTIWTQQYGGTNEIEERVFKFLHGQMSLMPLAHQALLNSIVHGRIAQIG